MAASKDKKFLIATKDLVNYFTGKEEDFHFTMMGIMICAEGYEAELEKLLSKTMEQVNFGKV
jgi:hypothetical protein